MYICTTCVCYFAKHVVLHWKETCGVLVCVCASVCVCMRACVCVCVTDCSRVPGSLESCDSTWHRLWHILPPACLTGYPSSLREREGENECVCVCVCANVVRMNVHIQYVLYMCESESVRVHVCVCVHVCERACVILTS